MTQTQLSSRATEQLVSALIDVELQRLGHPRTSEGKPVLDSLDRFGVMAILCETFDLAEPDQQPDPADQVMHWAAWAAAQRPTRIVVRTSGSTGKPRSCGHDTTDLIGEATFFADKLSDRRRIISLVPAHHIYGLIWTILLPDILGIPVVKGQVGAMPRLADGDMIVAVPDQWEALSRLVRHWPAGVTGISSAGPLDTEVAEKAFAHGLTNMLEIYGSSETGGIGLRHVPDDGFELLPRWQLTPDSAGIQTCDGLPVTLPDRLYYLGENRIMPAGRHDAAVKIGGHNVYPTQIAALLRTIEGVEDAAVRLGSNGRLKAFITPKNLTQIEKTEVSVRASILHLSPAEQPTHFRFGTALPTNAMGKMTDWE